MRTKIILSVLIIFSGTLSSQSMLTNKIEIKKSINSYYIENSHISSLKYKYINNSNDTLWLWIEKGGKKDDVYKTKIDNYFFKQKSEGNPSLYQIGMDVNTGVFDPALFISFIKKVLPHQSFEIEVISKKYLSPQLEQSVHSFLDKNVVICSENIITKISPSLKNMVEFIFYHQDSITLLFELLPIVPS